MGDVTIEELASPEEVLAASGFDPFARGTLRPDRVLGPAWQVTDRHGSAVGWTGTDQEELRGYLSVLGDPSAAAALVANGLTVLPAELETRVTVPRGTLPLLAGYGLRVTEPGDWEFRWTATPPPPPAVPPPPAWIEDSTGGRRLVAGLLAEASPNASAQADSQHVRRWAAIPGPEGLLAVAADTTGAPGVGHISSIATRPSARGRGLGAAITSWVTRRLLAEDCDVVTLGMYGNNDTAIRLYARLGFLAVHQFSSGPVTCT